MDIILLDIHFLSCDMIFLFSIPSPFLFFCFFPCLFSTCPKSRVVILLCFYLLSAFSLCLERPFSQTKARGSICCQPSWRSVMSGLSRQRLHSLVILKTNLLHPHNYHMSRETHKYRVFFQDIDNTCFKAWRHALLSRQAAFVIVGEENLMFSLHVPLFFSPGSCLSP